MSKLLSPYRFWISDVFERDSMKQFKTFYAGDICWVVLQTQGGSELHLKFIDRRCGNPGQTIKSFILRENNMTPHPTPCQAYREGSELMTTEAETQELHFFPGRSETQTSKRGLRIRSAGCSSLCWHLCWSATIPSTFLQLQKNKRLALPKADTPHALF